MVTMLTVNEAARWLGVKPATVRSWVRKRQIEYVKISRSVRISTTVVQDLISRGTQPAVARVR